MSHYQQRPSQQQQQQVHQSQPQHPQTQQQVHQHYHYQQSPSTSLPSTPTTQQNAYGLSPVLTIVAIMIALGLAVVFFSFFGTFILGGLLIFGLYVVAPVLALIGCWQIYTWVYRGH